jgi:hypothetical protein
MTDDRQAERPTEDGRAERPTEDGRAKKRLWLMTLVRLAGIGVVLAGMAVAGKSGGDGVRLAAGLLLMAGGGTFSLLGPRWFARRWKP